MSTDDRDQAKVWSTQAWVSATRAWASAYATSKRRRLHDRN
jgi:hypothetical protein